jgi:choline dehydrogenase-like flavoprotein
MKYDVIIVGSGAGGSAAAYHLSQSGQKVLLLERGEALPRDRSTLSVEKVLKLGTFKHSELWMDSKENTLHPSEFSNLGGKTKWYGAALLRFSPVEFGPDAAHQCVGWPLGYDDMAPFYDEAERLLAVRTFPTEPDLERIVTGMRSADPAWERQPLPVGLDAAIVEDVEEVTHFDGFALPSGRKSDAQVALLDRVRHQPNLEIRTGSGVVALKPDPVSPRKVTGVVTADGREYDADVVVLAGGALNSPRLLQTYLDLTGLDSRLPCAANVGRNYKCHFNSALVAISLRPKTDVMCKTTLLLNQRFPHSSVQNTGWLDGEIVRVEAPGFVPHWITDAIGRRAYGFWLTTEDGSHFDNRVVGQMNGASRPHLDYDTARLPAAEAEHTQLIGAVRRRLLGLGYASVVKRMPLEATAHACGTLMAGSDPAKSVVDANGRVHGLANVYVADGSALPRSSRVNPALTIYAWGLRVASQLQRP